MHHFCTLVHALACCQECTSVITCLRLGFCSAAVRPLQGAFTMVQSLMMLLHVFQGDIVLLSRGQPGPDSHEAVVLDFSSR